MFEGSVFLSSFLFLWTATVAFQDRPNLKRACTWSWAGLVLAICPGACLMPAYSLHVVLLGLVGTVCYLAGVNVRTYVVCSTTAFLGAYAPFVFLAIKDINETKQRYPMESMTDRLAYAVLTARPVSSADTGKPSAPLALEQLERTPDWVGEFDLQVKDRVDRGYRRNAGLQRLHEETVTWFKNAPAFGVSRMRENPIPGRKAQAVSQPDPLVLFEEPFDAARARAASSGPESPEPDTLWQTHFDSLLDFVNAEGFGYIKDCRHVAGFQSHQFRSVPRVAGGDAKQAWSVRRVELVSLLKNPRPAVYVSEHLPRMAELRDAPTRPLDGFEAAMLPALQQGEDLKLDYGPETIRMLGAIRAGEQCLKCHDGQRGDLLGAFSYRLKRGAGAVKTP
jgi:hypothetical protein